MRHYLQYHSMARMGRPPRGSFYIITKKGVSPGEVTGSRVWLILGEGKSPTRFSLHSTFTVDKVEDVHEDGFRTRISGTTGKLFEPTIPLDDTPWFPGFKERNGNFAFGFTPITDAEVVAALARMAGI